MRESGEQHRFLYRSRSGAILGVCKGVADYFDVSVFWTRVVAIMALIFSGFMPVVLLYVAAALLMKPEPALPLCSDDDEEFYHTYASSRTLAVQRLKRTYDNLERRIRRMEDIVTAPGYDWERRINE